MHGDAHGCRAQHFFAKLVALLEDFQHSAVFVVYRFHPLDSLMIVGVEAFAFGLDALQAKAGERVPKLAVDELKTLAVIFVRGVVVRRQGPARTPRCRWRLLDLEGRTRVSSSCSGSH